MNTSALVIKIYGIEIGVSNQLVILVKPLEYVHRLISMYFMTEFCKLETINAFELNNLNWNIQMVLEYMILISFYLILKLGCEMLLRTSTILVHLLFLRIFFSQLSIQMTSELIFNAYCNVPVLCCIWCSVFYTSRLTMAIKHEIPTFFMSPFHKEIYFFKKLTFFCSMK